SETPRGSTSLSIPEPAGWLTAEQHQPREGSVPVGDLQVGIPTFAMEREIVQDDALPDALDGADRCLHLGPNLSHLAVRDGVTEFGRRDRVDPIELMGLERLQDFVRRHDASSWSDGPRARDATAGWWGGRHRAGARRRRTWSTWSAGVRGHAPW